VNDLKNEMLTFFLEIADVVAFDIDQR